MENIGAVKELCKVTGKLETRIDHLEKITKANRTSSNNSSIRYNNDKIVYLHDTLWKISIVYMENA
jgi:hypothetical protein